MRNRTCILVAVAGVATLLALVAAIPTGSAGARQARSSSPGETSRVTYSGTLNNEVQLTDSSNHVYEIFTQDVTWNATWTGPTDMISDGSGMTLPWTSLSLSGSDSIQYPDGQQPNCADSLSAAPGQTFTAILPTDTNSVIFGFNTPTPKQTATEGGGCAMPGRLGCPLGTPPGEQPGASYCSPSPEWNFRAGSKTFNISSNYGPTDLGGKIVTSDLSSTVSVGGVGCALGRPPAGGRPVAYAAAAVKNLVLYSARGSSEVRSGSDPLALGKPALALYRVLKARAGKSGDVDLFADGDPYPAQDIQEGMRKDLAERVWLTTNYKRSVAEGVSKGIPALERITSQQEATGKCWALVLSGYSQGAEVMRRVMAGLPRDVLTHVAAVVLYGDPYFRPRESNVDPRGGFLESAIGVRRYDWEQFQNGPPPPALALPTFSWCRPHDLVCGFNNSLRRLLFRQSTISAEEDGHFHYDEDACQAANQIVSKLRPRGFDLESKSC